MNNNFDIIVIGSGSGGLTVAIGLANTLKKVALIEKGPIGGDCTNFGCIPSKALLDISKKGNTSFIEALKETRIIRQHIREEETKEKLEKYGIIFFVGFASFKDKNTILIDGKKEITGKNIIISSGSKAQILEIDGVNKEDIMTNETIFEQTKDIKNLVIIGGGYIGCEIAEAFSGLGVKISIIQRNEFLIPKEEKESSKLLKEIFEKKGINVFTKTNILYSKNNYLYIKTPFGEEKIFYDKILISLGKEPNLKNLGLENAGIKYDKGIIVDKYNRTSQKNIFAIGDCVDNNPQFTHLSNNEGRGVIRNIMFPYIKKSIKNSILPSVLYTNIEISRVGEIEEELLKNYSKDEIKTYIIYFKNNDKSKVTYDTIGFIKVNFGVLTGKILGATIMGSGAGEMISVFTLSIEKNISAYKLSNMIFPYPTKSEIIKKICDKYVIGTLSNLKNDIKIYLKEKIFIIVGSFVWISIIILFYFLKNKLGLSNEELVLKIYNLLSKSSLGIILYIFIYTIRPIIFFPATILTFLSGALFGPIYGIIYTIIGENLSANLAYFLGKIYGNKIIKNNKIGFLSNLSKKSNNKPFLTVFLARTLFLPFDLTNYGAGFLKIKWKSYFLATFIGILPGLIIFVLAGASFYKQELGSFSDFTKNIDVTYLYISSLLFLITIILSYFLKRKL